MVVDLKHELMLIADCHVDGQLVAEPVAAAESMLDFEIFVEPVGSVP